MDKPEIDHERLKQYGAGWNEDGSDNEPFTGYYEPYQEPPAKFCGSECRNNYREDRLNCKELAPVSMGGQMVSYKTMCARLSLCAYCQSKLEK